MSLMQEGHLQGHFIWNWQAGSSVLRYVIFYINFFLILKSLLPTIRTTEPVLHNQT